MKARIIRNDATQPLEKALNRFIGWFSILPWGQWNVSNEKTKEQKHSKAENIEICSWIHIKDSM